jgi:hypothetical protein
MHYAFHLNFVHVCTRRLHKNQFNLLTFAAFYFDLPVDFSQSIAQKPTFLKKPPPTDVKNSNFPLFIIDFSEFFFGLGYLREKGKKA